ncbi:MAG: hypothetical protein Q9227_007688 [Pyrenula ochraceoflavens]
MSQGIAHDHISSLSLSEEPRFVSIEPRLTHGTEVEYVWKSTLARGFVLTFLSIVAVPAIGADPQQTWTARPDLESRRSSRPHYRAVSKTHSATLIPLASSLAPAVQEAIPQPSMPSLRYDPASAPLEAPRGPRDGPILLDWPTHELRLKIGNARVLLYDHGKAAESDSVYDVARKLLNKLSEDEGRRSTTPRPIFFLCHSTGGIVAKAAITMSVEMPGFEQIAQDCFGFTFFSTPHQGSSYLASREFIHSIADELALRWTMSDELRKSFAINHLSLSQIDNKFKALSADLRIFSFYETVDTELLLTPTTDPSAQPTPFRAPITSIRSAILDLENELEIPLPCTHVGTATFQGVADPTSGRFLKELKADIDASVVLSRKDNYKMDVDDQVVVEVNGFYEDTALGISSTSPLNLWSTRRSLRDFLRLGPSRCLEARLREPASHLTSQGRRRSIMSIIREPLEGANPDSASYSAFSNSANLPQETSSMALSARPTQEGNDHSEPSEHAIRAPSINIRLQREATFPTDVTENLGPLQSESSRVSPFLSFETPFKNLGRSPEASTLMSSNQLQRTRTYTAERRQSSPGHLNPSVHFSQKQHEKPPQPSIPSKKVESASHKFSWMHIPFNNSSWVPLVLEKVGRDKGRNTHAGLLHPSIWGAKHVKGRHAAPHARFVKHTCVRPSSEGQGQPHGTTMASHFSLAFYMPYLHWDTYGRLVARREIIARRLKQGRVRPVSEDIANSSLENKMIWQYLGSNPPFHCRRTLDQFGYPNLRNTKARDDDQILYKRTRERAPHLKSMRMTKQAKKAGKISKEPEIIEGNVLMVDQLWLWILDDTNVVTMFPQRDSAATEGRLYQ